MATFGVIHRREELGEPFEGEPEDLSQMEKHGWTNLVAAIGRILAGERNEQSLCAPLDVEDSMIIETILRAIADPTTLSALLPSEGGGS